MEITKNLKRVVKSDASTGFRTTTTKGGWVLANGCEMIYVQQTHTGWHGAKSSTPVYYYCSCGRKAVKAGRVSRAIVAQHDQMKAGA
jgi:hypothetical protein